MKILLPLIAAILILGAIAIFGGMAQIITTTVKVMTKNSESK